MNPPTDPAKPDGADAAILVVDDEPANLGVLNAVLQPHFRVRVARSGAEALRAVGTAPLPDLVLLDVMMPEMDGYTVLARLREAPASRELSVIFVTAMDSMENEQRGLELGAVDYITKPISPAIVLARVRAQLELKAARDRLAEGRGHRYDLQVVDRLEPLLSFDEHDKIDEIRVSAGHLQDGTVLTRDVMHPDGFLLLSKNTVVVRRLIDQLATVERDAGRNMDIYVLCQRVGH